MKNLNKKMMIFFMTIISGNYSCKKFLEIGPPKNSATPIEMFSNDAIATSAITGIYSRMTANGGFAGGNSSISVLAGLSSDDLKSHSGSLDVFYKNAIPTNSSQINTLWGNAYTFIYTSNAILEGLQSGQGVSEATKRQLQGEAKFVRAFCYFYLVNLFGEVPLNLTTNYQTNERASKTSKDNIYDQIKIDLTDAENLLSDNYITNERIRPNKWCAKALLAKVYLYTGNWEEAVLKAGEVIDKTALYTLLDDIDKVFLKNSQEAIWQLMPTVGTNTQEGALFILTSTPTSVSLTPDLLLAFDLGDNRKLKWIGSFTNATGTYYYPYKYKTKTTANGVINEYSMVIRLAEMYLIRAECNARLQHVDLALQDINLVRKRAGLIIPLSDINQNQIIIEVEKQRRLELFTEWGNRWLDLNRTLRSTAVLGPIKGANWSENDILYPIPDNEINRNPNIKQNTGY